MSFYTFFFPADPPAALTAEAGSYVFQGQTATLLWGRDLTAEAGQYLLLGAPAGLIGPGGLSLQIASYHYNHSLRM